MAIIRNGWVKERCDEEYDEEYKTRYYTEEIHKDYPERELEVNFELYVSKRERKVDSADLLTSRKDRIDFSIGFEGDEVYIKYRHNQWKVSKKDIRRAMNLRPSLGSLIDAFPETDQVIEKIFSWLKKQLEQGIKSK